MKSIDQGEGYTTRFPKRKSLSVFFPYSSIRRSAADKAGSEWRWFEDLVIELHRCRSRRLSRARACPERSRRGARATSKKHDGSGKNLLGRWRGAHPAHF